MSVRPPMDKSVPFKQRSFGEQASSLTEMFIELRDAMKIHIANAPDADEARTRCEQQVNRYICQTGLFDHQSK